MIIAQSNTENGEVILRQGSAGYEIIVDGQFLMSSASGDSSVALVELGLAELKQQTGLKVLIGGLGLGYSLKAALGDARVTQVTVVELEKEIIGWHRQGLIGETVRLFNDPRARVIEGDFIRFSLECGAQFDLIALDIDNGPDWLSHEPNCRLYKPGYLHHLTGMLRPQGVLTFWSAAPSIQLMRNLEEIFGNVAEAEVKDDNGEGKPITAYIYICKFRKE